MSTLDRLRPFVERACGFSGWTFDDLGVRDLEPGPPWDYGALVSEQAAGASSALDMGTGGGERLAGWRSALPDRLIATEGWHVNAPVSRDRLRPLSVDVVHCRSLNLPFGDGKFALLLNRHEELEPHEVARVLRPGGAVVTQQVGRSSWQELRRHFPRMTDFGDVRGAYLRGFASAGLEVAEDREHEWHVVFPSLGELIYMLIVAPWTIPDFDVERDLEALLAVEEACSTAGGLVLTENRFVIVARKPESGR